MQLEGTIELFLHNALRVCQLQLDQSTQLWRLEPSSLSFCQTTVFAEKTKTTNTAQMTQKPKRIILKILKETQTETTIAAFNRKYDFFCHFLTFTFTLHSMSSKWGHMFCTFNLVFRFLLCKLGLKCLFDTLLSIYCEHGNMTFHFTYHIKF